MLIVEDIARICHEANRALQAVQADPGIAVAPPWDDCGAEMQASVIDGVQGVLNGNTPEESHQSWINFKEAHGWVYGEVKDEVAKTHPCLVPYDQLPPSQQIKDGLFSAIVTALRGAL